MEEVLWRRYYEEVLCGGIMRRYYEEVLCKDYTAFLGE